MIERLVAPHIFYREIICKCKCGCGTGEYPVLIHPYIACIFEQIRVACGGGSLHITNGWRCPKHNKEVGGSSGSQHLFGRAIDIAKPDFMALLEFVGIVDKIVGPGGMGIYLWGIHADVGFLFGLPEHRRWENIKKEIE